MQSQQCNLLIRYSEEPIIETAFHSPFRISLKLYFNPLFLVYLIEETELTI
jgi:hypothetical protein